MWIATGGANTDSSTYSFYFGDLCLRSDRNTFRAPGPRKGPVGAPLRPRHPAPAADDLAPLRPLFRSGNRGQGGNLGGYRSTGRPGPGPEVPSGRMSPRVTDADSVATRGCKAAAAGTVHAPSANRAPPAQ